MPFFDNDSTNQDTVKYVPLVYVNSFAVTCPKTSVDRKEFDDIKAKIAGLQEKLLELSDTSKLTLPSGTIYEKGKLAKTGEALSAQPQVILDTMLIVSSMRLPVGEVAASDLSDLL